MINLTEKQLEDIVYNATLRAIKDSKRKPRRESPQTSAQREVWNHWLATFGHLHPRMRNMTSDVRRLIDTRLKTYSVDQLKYVISYIPNDDWYMGRDSQSKTSYYFIKNIMVSDSRVSELTIRADNFYRSEQNSSVTIADALLRIDGACEKVRFGDCSMDEKNDFIADVDLVEGLSSKRFDWERYEFTDGEA